MTARGRNTNDWDLMRDDYNSSYHDSQYDDDMGGIQHDHCRLYILNIPKGLSEEGLRTAFAKFGTLTEVYESKDPTKKYALVRYETPGEAKLAMTKLNNTEPMKLQISIARKTRVKKDNYSRDSVNRNYANGPANRSIRDDNGSVSSKKSSRLQEEFINGDNMEDILPPLDDDMDSETKIKGLQLELQRLQVQEQTVLLRQQLFQLEAARKKNLTQSTMSNRCILPDGRIVVRNVADRNLEARDVEGSFAAGAGDSLTIPALQRGACVACGAPADAVCARCGLAPYCSVQCQRRDWADRHRACCHNLARLAGKKDVNSSDVTEPEMESIPQAPALRQPHPSANRPRKDEETPATAGPKKPMHNNANNKQHDGRNNNRAPRNNNGSFNNKNRQNDRKPAQQVTKHDEEEDWGNKTSTPAAAPAATPAAITTPSATAPAASATAEAKAPVPDTRAVKDTPAKTIPEMVPKDYMIGLLSPDDTALLSLSDVSACVALHERFEPQYQRLCEPYAAACMETPGTSRPVPGQLFSYLDPSDGGWYRARCLSTTQAALVDAGRVVALPEGPVRPVPEPYDAEPEFCCTLKAVGVKAGSNLSCKLISKTPNGFKVSLTDIESGAALGEGEVSRWTPPVEHPAPAAAPNPAPLPEVPRPDLANNSSVLLVDATAFDRAFVRPSDADSQRRFDQTLEEVVMHAQGATPLTEPPVKGQEVIGKFTDGLFYRALVKRTNIKQNKYMLEYIEFGNVEITQLENIYACPLSLQLTCRPAEASLVSLKACRVPFAAPAVSYLDALKDSMQPLRLTLPTGAKTAPSGAEVILTEEKTNESVNKKLEAMCTPEWKKLEEQGADVVELKPIMFNELEVLEMPSTGCLVDVLDASGLHAGVVSGCEAGHPRYERVLKGLTQRMEEYCNSRLGKEPYLPKFEELCLARFPPYPQWFRAVLLEQTPGASVARVLYVDYGNVGEVPVAALRKTLPEFVRGEPALASHLEIRDFPKNPTVEQLERAFRHMQIDEEGRGKLRVERCERQDRGMYLVSAPALIKAMNEQ